jgi:methylated-DNA-[protein]-cysteine S-methyltransferase
MPKSHQPLVYYRWIDSPLGELLLTANEIALTALALKEQKYFPEPSPHWQAKPDLAILNQAQTQLQEYFDGDRHTFDLPLAPQGTAFQQQVWQCLGDIPFGETRTYGQLAQAIAQPSAVRAVGAANGRNPISIIVPCHRVIARDGTLTGYAGGIERKQWLLNHEQQKGQPQQGNLFTQP